MRAGRPWVAEELEELRVRVKRARMPSEAMPWVTSAAPPAAAVHALERGLQEALGRIDHTALTLERRLNAAARGQGETRRANRTLTLLQLHADQVFKTLELYAHALTTRTDATMGMLLAGCDRVVAEALRCRVPGYAPPTAVTYLDSAARGGAIIRARTRLPGGVTLPVALVRVSPESLPTRLSAVLHEAGHQVVADFHLLEEAQRVMGAALAGAGSAVGTVWPMFANEVVPDVWSILLAGAPAVDGLQRVLSLPTPLLFSIRPGDPHPPGAARVAFALALASRLESGPVLQQLDARWREVVGAPRGTKPGVVDALVQTAPVMAQALLEHRFSGLGGRRLIDVANRDGLERAAAGNGAPSGEELSSLAPLQALARINYARLRGSLSASAFDTLGRQWLYALARAEDSVRAPARNSFIPAKSLSVQRRSA